MALAWRRSMHRRPYMGAPCRDCVLFVSHSPHLRFRRSGGGPRRL